jgi:hypothetical protein
MLLSSRAGVGNSEGERSGSGSSAVWCNGKCAGGDLIEKSTDPPPSAFVLRQSACGGCEGPTISRYTARIVFAASESVRLVPR